jgi:hypothetical protein
VGDHGPTGRGGIYGLSEERILDFVTERIKQEGRGGEALWTAPTKERTSPSKKRRTGSASSMDMKGGRTRKEELHKERKHMEGERTQREEGHKGREEGERHHGLLQQRRCNCLVSREKQALPHQWT